MYFYELTDGIVGAKDLLVDELFWEVSSEEGGEGGGQCGWGLMKGFWQNLLPFGELCPLEDSCYSKQLFEEDQNCRI